MSRLTNTQVTVVIVTALLCLGLPAGALAASVSKVVVSGSNGKTAKVSGGRLQVAANVGGTVKTKQQGAVTTELAPPASFVHKTTVLVDGGSGCDVIYTAPAGATVVVRQVGINVWDTGVGGFAGIFTTSDCSDLGIGVLNPPSVGYFPIDLDPGYALPAGASLYAGGNGELGAYTFVNGFKVAP